MAEVEKLTGSESPLEIGQKINEIIENGGGSGGLEICDIGIALYIDESKGLRRWLNGQIVAINNNTQGFLNRLKKIRELHPSLFTTEENWQATKTLSDFGQVGLFVIDEEAGTIHIPAVVNIQGLFDLQNLGLTVKAGLPNIVGSLYYTPRHDFYGNSTGAFKNITTGSSACSWNTRDTGSTAFDASLSNPIYGNSNTVQQEQIQYPYFIQVATGAETEDNIINEIELNNPFSLLDYKFSEYELNNLSWLRSNGQWNSKAVYPAVYELLLKIYNGTETKAGVSVKLSTETYADADFVLDTANETFRLPIKVKLASGKAVIGNGMSLGLTNGNNAINYGVGSSGSANYLLPYTSLYGKMINSSPSLSGDGTTRGVYGITTDPTKSGIETSDSDLYLYFYVGETVQNANLINAGRIEEKIVSCITRFDCPAYITETYVNGASGYNIYSNGYCEQWGQASISGNSSASVALLKTFKNTNYSALVTPQTTTLDNMDGWGCTKESVSSIRIYLGFNTTSVMTWRACGYIA